MLIKNGVSIIFMLYFRQDSTLGVYMQGMIYFKRRKRIGFNECSWYNYK